MARPGPIRSALEYAAARPLVFALEWAPLPAARALAAALAELLYRFTAKWRRVGLRNLEIAFPEADEAERRRILRDSYRNLGRVLLALARLPRLTRESIGDWIRYEGFEHYQNAIAAGRGVIFLTAHLGCWELSSAAHALFGNPMHVMVRPLDNPHLDKLVDRRRSLNGNCTIRKKGAAKAVLQALRRNEAVGILADQNAAGDDGVFVNVFGRQASATAGVARLAARSGAAVVPGFAFWNPNESRCVLTFYAPVETVSSGDADADVLENTGRFQRAIERAVREHPDQWLWVHRRWKRRPPGEAPIYD